jgi:hypothetical protein
LNDITGIISELERERSAIDRAISALREVTGQPGTSEPIRQAASAVTKKRQLSPEGRKRIIEATKKRWAAKRAALKREAASQSRTGTTRNSSKSTTKPHAGTKKTATKK